MEISFYKYQGTGNDFVIIDQRNKDFNLSQQQIALICHRRFGVGADGLMYLRSHPDFDFEMVYFNADGKPSTMCGNGGRCISHLYSQLAGNSQIKKIFFMAIDGPHEAIIKESDEVSLQMRNVVGLEAKEAIVILDTGSPHYVLSVDKVEEINVNKEGASIRYSEKYAKDGINVNFLECADDHIKVRTYERGVEEETLSCGTGVTAAAIATDVLGDGRYGNLITVDTLGGTLKVAFERREGGYQDVWLTGPAKLVFAGRINIS